ncbi:MAG TPA: Ig-like domain-containing protein [Candidatus Tectomicrobia bacterium]
MTVRFSCADTTSGIATCSTPVTVATEGINQRVSGTATDHAGNSSTVSTTVNLDTTPPSVDITSPANGSTLHTSETTVIGTVSDILSGVANVTCNGKAASVSGSTFVCALSLSEGGYSDLTLSFTVSNRHHGVQVEIEDLHTL